MTSVDITRCIVALFGLSLATTTTYSQGPVARFCAVGDAVIAVNSDERSLAAIYQFPPQSVVTAIEVRGNDLYVATRSAVYVIPGGVRQRDNPRPLKLIWGIPRGLGDQGFRSLAWGPEGDLYCSFGDADDPKRWRHWTFFSGPEKSKTPYSGIGGVLRCKPDGSGLTIVANGLRDPRDLAFDRYWNLFAADIDENGTRTGLRISPYACFGFPRDGTSLLPAVLDRDRPHAGSSDVHDQIAGIEIDKLWTELAAPTFDRRRRAHLELLRRGESLALANQKLLHAKADDPAIHHLIWLAAKSQQGSLHLVSLLADPDPLVRVQTIRALTEFPEQLRGEPVFTKLLLDADPRVQMATMLAFYSPKIAWDSAAQFAIERGPARSDDPLLRQTATRLLARKASVKQLEALCGRADESLRMIGVLAAGHRLTVPRPMHAQLPLRALPTEACIVEYADGKVDLRRQCRLGTFTLAEHWKADMHSAEDERLFGLLGKMLRDEDRPVREQAARFLALLDDPRQAPR